MIVSAPTVFTTGPNGRSRISNVGRSPSYFGVTNTGFSG
jgi:hypothetical protein